MPVEQHFTFYGAHVGQATIDPIQVSGTERFGEPVLRVSVECWFFNQGEGANRRDLMVHSPEARLSLDNQVLSKAEPIGGGALCSMGYKAKQSFRMDLEFPITSRQLERIEQQRRGNMNFRVSIRVTVTRFRSRPKASRSDGFSPRPFGPDYQEGSAVELSFEVPSSVWIEKVLPGLGYGKIHVIELPVVELQAISGNARALEALSRAAEAFRKGLYDHAVGDCRIALEGFLEKDANVPSGTKRKKNSQGKKLKGTWRQSLGEATANWIEACMLRISKETNKPHHDPSGVFSRLEAQMVILITTGLIAHLLQERPFQKSLDSAPSVPS